LKRQEHIDMVAAILTSGHVINTAHEEDIGEAIGLFKRYRNQLESII